MVKKVSNVQVYERLGGGQFSDVYRGNWMVFPKVTISHFLGNYTSCLKTASKI